MSLSDLILGKSKLAGLCPATPAIFATQPKGEAETVARIATVAVVTPKDEKTAPPTKVGAGDAETLAESIATEHGITTGQVWGLLDDDDMALIQAGDQPTMDAWRCAAELRTKMGLWDSLPGNDALEIITPAKVTCASCRHAQPTSHPVLVNCGAGRMAPGACGLWWGTDLHECTDFPEVTP